MTAFANTIGAMTGPFPASPKAVVVTSANRDQELAGAPLFFRLAFNVASRIKFGSLVFHLPDGRVLKCEGDAETSSEGVIIVKDYRFAKRSLLGGSIGFFESFADEQWDTPSVGDVLYVFARNADHVKEAFLQFPPIAWFENLRHRLHKNTRAGARRNIMAHYDLGNGFYEKWLDGTMTYSSAIYPTPNTNLSDAQTNKYRALAQTISLQQGDEILEIGSGWGGFAEYAAKHHDAKVTGLTISQAQYEYASERIFKQGLNDKVQFRLQDYRDVSGAFDKVASIEMFEAVGKEYWPTYFTKVRDVLRPGGVAGLQVITIADRFFHQYQQGTDFIQRHIFPGGMLPSPSALKSQIERAGLAWRQGTSFGPDYARTLIEWRERFLAAWSEIREMGFDERFRKLWLFYLGYCEAGFRAKTTDVYQVAAARP